MAPSTPADSNAAANSVAEGAANGTTVGITASSTDPNGPAVSFSLTDSAGGRFAINPSTGVVTVANGSLISLASSYTIAVRASDGSLSSSPASLSIAVTSLASIIDGQTTLSGGLKSALKDKLDKAASFFASGKLSDACGKLDEFISQVNSVTPGRLTQPMAAVLLGGANARKAAYGCP